MKAKSPRTPRPTQRRSGLAWLLAVSLASPLLSESRGGTITGSGPVIGRIFNNSTRQHIQANFQGSGIHRPSGKTGTVNGGFSSLPGQRSPQATILGGYRVLVRANVRYGGGSTSVTRRVVATVGRRTILVGGAGRIRLNRPLNPTKAGRQNFRGVGTVTVSGV